MRRALFVLVLVALAVVAINVAVAYPVADRLVRGAISTRDYVTYLRHSAFLSTAATLGSFAVGVLACALAIQRRQPGWTVLLASLLLVSAYLWPVLGEINAAQQQSISIFLLGHAPVAQVALDALRTSVPAFAALLYVIAVDRSARPAAADQPDTSPTPG